MNKSPFLLFLIVNIFFVSKSLNSARIYEDIKTGTLTVKLGGKSTGTGSIRQNEVEKEAKRIIEKGHIKNVVFDIEQNEKHLKIKSKIESFFATYKNNFYLNKVLVEEKKGNPLFPLNIQESALLLEEDSDDSSITTTSSPSSSRSSYSSDEIMGPEPTRVEIYEEKRKPSHAKYFKEDTGYESARKYLENLNLDDEVKNPQISHSQAFRNHGPTADSTNNNLAVLSQKANLKMKCVDGKYINGDIDGNFFVVKKNTKAASHSVQQLQSPTQPNLPITPSIVIQSSIGEFSKEETKRFKQKVDRNLNPNRMKIIEETYQKRAPKDITLETSRKKIKKKINALENEGKTGPFFIKFSDQSRINRFLDGDSAELLEDSLQPLSKKEIKRIRKKLRTEIPLEKRQMVFDLAFRTVLGYSYNYDFTLKNITYIIDELAKSLKNIPVNQISDVDKIADSIFGCDYYDVNSDHFDLEDRLVIFHSFLTSLNNHLMDKENRYDLLYVYHMIYDNLREMEIESTDIQDYLADFAQGFKKLSDEDLKDICSTVNSIYEGDGYSNLKGSHGCEDWEALATQIFELDTKKRKILSDFLSWLPTTFNFGPAEAIEILKDESWMKKIDQLESFERLENLTKEAFQLLDDQSDQLEALNLIILGIIEKKSDKKIIKEIKGL